MNRGLLSFQKVFNNPQYFDFAPFGIIKTRSIDETDSTTFEFKIGCSLRYLSTGIQGVGGSEVRTTSEVYKLLRQINEILVSSENGILQSISRSP